MKILNFKTLSFISAGITTGLDNNIDDIDMNMDMNNKNSWASKALQAYQNYCPCNATLGYIGAVFAVMGIGYLIGKKMNNTFSDYSDPFD